MTTTDDAAKYFLALGSRNIRRIAAKVDAAIADAAVRETLMKELTQVIKWQQAAVISGWLRNDHFSDGADSEERTVEIDLRTYSNGQPVFTVVDWWDGYATVVHSPNPLHRQPEDAGELTEEICPCCGGMPSVARGDDDGDFGVRKNE